MASLAPSCSASSLSSSLIPGSFAPKSSQPLQVRCVPVTTPYLQLTRHLHKRQGVTSNRSVHIYAEYNGRRGGGAGDFVAGFLLGGVVFGALGYLFAPQVSKTLSGGDRERDEPSKKLPKSLDDDEGLEKTRRNLNEKIAQLNAAIDDVSSQLRADDGFVVANGTTSELESAA